MNLKLPILGLLLTASVLTATAASLDDNSSYVRVSGLYLVPSGNLFDDGAGILVANGIQFNERYGSSAHQLEFEAGWAKLDATASALAGAPAGSNADLQIIPLLLTYRYVWKPTERLSLGIGPSVGGSYMRLSASVPGVGSDSDSDFVFSYGLGALVSFAVTETLSVDAGYRYLWTSDANFSGFKLENNKGQLIQLGLRLNY